MTLHFQSGKQVFNCKLNLMLIVSLFEFSCHGNNQSSVYVLSESVLASITKGSVGMSSGLLLFTMKTFIQHSSKEQVNHLCWSGGILKDGQDRLVEAGVRIHLYTSHTTLRFI